MWPVEIFAALHLSQAPEAIAHLEGFLSNALIARARRDMNLPAILSSITCCSHSYPP